MELMWCWTCFFHFAKGDYALTYSRQLNLQFMHSSTYLTLNQLVYLYIGTTALLLNQWKCIDTRALKLGLTNCSATTLPQKWKVCIRHRVGLRATAMIRMSRHLAKAQWRRLKVAGYYNRQLTAQSTHCGHVGS